MFDLQYAFKDVLNLHWYEILIVVLLLACGIGVIVAGKKTKWTTKMLSNGAMCIALAFVLCQIRFFRMPQGGSIKLFPMLPIVLFSFAYGAGPGVIVGAAVGLMRLLNDPDIVHPLQLLLDYPVAYGLVGLSGLFRSKGVLHSWQLAVGTFVGGFLRYVAAVLSGMVFFAEYAPANTSAWLYSLTHFIDYWDEYEALEAQITNTIPQSLGVFIYSASYNGVYLGIELLITMVVALIPVMPKLVKMMRGDRA